MLVDVGRLHAIFGLLRARVVGLRPKPGQIWTSGLSGRIRGHVGRLRAEFGRMCPMLGQRWLIGGQFWANLGKCRSNSGQCSSSPGIFWSDLVEIEATLVACGPILAEFGSLSVHPDPNLIGATAHDIQVHSDRSVA